MNAKTDEETDVDQKRKGTEGRWLEKCNLMYFVGEIF